MERDKKIKAAKEEHYNDPWHKRFGVYVLNLTLEAITAKAEILNDVCTKSTLKRLVSTTFNRFVEAFDEHAKQSRCK